MALRIASMSANSAKVDKLAIKSRPKSTSQFDEGTKFAFLPDDTSSP